MSSNLDKSLDEIIGSKSRRATRGSRSSAPRRASKQVNPSRRQRVGRGAPSAATAVPRLRQRAPVNAVSRVSRILSAAGSARVSVEGLPRDIKQDAVREFFSSQVGGVQGVLLSYNERGQSTGMANITFKNSDLANKAVQKFNGAPIDGGRSRLKLNVIIDPTKAAQDLTRRIQPLPAKPVNPRSAVINKARGPTRKAALAKRARHQKKERPAKKSLEDLDKEMADYFGEKK